MFQAKQGRASARMIRGVCGRETALFSLFCILGLLLFVPSFSSAADTKNATREQTLETFQEVSWTYFQVIRNTAPELLWHRYQETQFTLSPFIQCLEGPLPNLEDPKAALHEALANAQTALKAYLTSSESTLFSKAQDLPLPQDSVSVQAQILPIKKNSFRCLPGTTFAPPQLWGDDPKRVRLNKEREDKYAQLLKITEEVGPPFAVSIGKILPNHVVSNVELTQWLTWIAYLRQIYTDYLALQSSELAVLPDFELPARLGKQIAEFQALQGFLKAGAGLGLPKKEGRLRAVEIVVENILTASSVKAQTPHFAPCRSATQTEQTWCFHDPELPAEEAMSARVLLKLHSPHLNYGSYLDSVLALAKQSQIQELTFINLLLPQTLKLKDLPEACFPKNPDGTSTVTGREMEGLRGLFQRFGSLKKREWLVQQIAQSTEALALDIQHRKVPVSFPGANLETFTFKGKKTNFAQLADSLMQEWFTRFTALYDPQIRAKAGESPTWNAIKNNIQERLKRVPFESYLRFQDGLAMQDDFNSILAEKIMVLFASVTPKLADVKELDSFSPEQVFHLNSLLFVQAIQAALLEAGATYLAQTLADVNFVNPEAKAEEKILEAAADDVLKLWNQEFEPQWRSAIETHGFTQTSDLRKLGKYLAETLKKTSPYQEVVDGKLTYDPDSASKKAVDARLEQGRPLWEQAARAEQTIEYLDTILKSKEDFLTNFLPGGWLSPWNYAYVDDLAPKNSGPACFHHLRNNGWNPLGVANKGLNPFGKIDPKTEADWEHFKKVLSAIAHRKKDDLIVRLKKAVDEDTLKSKYGYPDYDAFARRLLNRWDTLLEARPGLDTLHVTSLRENKLYPLAKELQKTSKAEQSYRSFTKDLAKQLYETELAPLLRASGKFSPEDRAYVEKYIQNVLQPKILLPGETKLSLALVEKAWEQSGEKDRVTVQSQFEALQSSLQKIKDKNLLSSKIKIEEAAAPFLEIAKKDPAFIKEQNTFLKNWLATNDAKTLFEARVAQALKPSTLKADAALSSYDYQGSVKAIEKNQAMKASFIQKTLYTAGLPFEAVQWAGGKPLGGWEAPLFRFTVRNAKVTPPPPHFQKATEQLKEVREKLAARKTQALAAMNSLTVMLQEAAKLPEINDDTTAQFFHKYVHEHPELFENFKNAILDLVTFVDTHLSEPNDEMLQVVFSAFNVAHELSFRTTFADAATLNETRRGQGQSVDAYLADHLFAPFEEVQKKMLNEISETLAVRVEPVDAIIQLEDSIERMQDEKALAKTQKKKADEEMADKVLARLNPRKKDYVDGLKQLGEMRALLAYLAPGFASAKEALKYSGEIKDDSTKIAFLFQRYVHERNIIGENKRLPLGDGTLRLSAAEIVADLNALSSLATEFYEITPELALMFLEDIQRYASAATSDLNRGIVQEWYRKTLQNSISETKQGGAAARSSKRRLIHLRSRYQVAAVAKQAWNSLKTLVTNPRAATQVDWSDLNKYPSVFTVLRDFSTRAEALQAGLKKLIEDAKKADKSLTAKDLKGTAFESRYWSLIQEVSDLMMHSTSVFSGLADKHKVADNEKDRLAPTSWEGVFFRLSPMDPAQHAVQYNTPNYVPHPSLVSPALASLLLHPKFPFSEVLSNDSLKKLDIAGPVKDQNLFDWVMKLTPAQRGNVYATIENAIDAALLSGAPWLTTLSQEWHGDESKLNTYDGQFIAWRQAVSSHLALFKSFNGKIFSLDPKANDRLGKIAHHAASLFFSSTLYRLEPNGEIKLLESDPGLLKLESTKAILAAWLNDYNTAETTDAKKAALKEAARSKWFVLVENIQGLFHFNSRSDLSKEHLAFYANPENQDSSADVGDMRYEKDTFSISTESRFFNFYYLFFKQGRLAFQGTPPSIMSWKTHYLTKENEERPVSKQPFPKFDLVWEPTGTKREDLAIFEGWFKNLRSKPYVEQAFKQVHDRTRKNPDPRRHLWEIYADLESFNQSGAAKYLRDFLARWDANAEAKEEPKTYQMFLALLEESLSEAAMATPPTKNGGMTETELSGYLREILALVPVRLDDFNSFKTIIEDRDLTQAEDWMLMAQSRLSLVSDVGRNREFSVKVGGTQQVGLLWNSLYNPFPSLLNEPEDGSFSTKVPPTFKEWIAPAKDQVRTVLWKVFESTKDVPAYKRFIADSLELQDEYEIRSRQKAIAEGRTPMHDRKSNNWYHQARYDFDRYFKEVNEEIDPKRFSEIKSIVQAQFPKEDAEKLQKLTLFVIQRYMDFVALEKIANEGLNEEESANLLAAYARRMEWKQGTPQPKALGHLGNRQQELAAQVGYVGRNILIGQLLVGKPKEESDKVAKILAITKTEYRNEAQSQTYFEELKAISKNVYGNLERLCQEPSFEGRVKDQTSFEDTKATILGVRIPVASTAVEYFTNAKVRKEKAHVLELRLPLMSGIMKYINHTAPTAAGDEARRMLRYLLIQEEKELQEQKEWEAWVNYVMLASLATHGGAKLSPAFGSWLANSTAAQAGNRMIGYALGGYFAYKFTYGMVKDFHWAPEKIERFRSVRDTLVLGEIPLVTDEDASLADDYDRNLEYQQYSKWSWLGRGWDLAIASNNFLVPTLKYVFNPRLIVNAGQRWSAWIWERSYMGRVLKTGFTYESVVKNQFRAEAEYRARAGFKLLGLGDGSKIPPEKLAEAVENQLEELILKKFGGEFRDGHWLPDTGIAKLLKKDVQRQVQQSASTASLDAHSLESTAKPITRGWFGKSPAKLTEDLNQFQAQTRTRLETLREIEAKLSGERPHLNVDDLKLLLGGQGSVFARHTPFIVGFTGVHIPTLNPFQLYRFYKVARLNTALNAGMDIHQGITYTLLSDWMDAYLVLEKSVGEKPLVQLIAEQRTMTTEQLVEAIARGEAFTTLGREDMKKAAQELRELLTLSGMPVTPELIRAIGNNDRATLLSIFKRTRFKFITVEQRSFARPSQKAATAAAEEEIAAEVSWNATEALKTYPTSEPIPRFEAYDQEIKRQLGGIAIGERVVNPDLISKLVRNYRSSTLEYALGKEFMRTHGTNLKSEAIDLRIAAHYRKAIELELIEFQSTNSNTGRGISELFKEMQTLHLTNVESIVQAEMSVREAMGTFDLSSPREALKKLNGAAGESESSLQQMADLLGVRVSYLKNPNLAKRITNHAMNRQSDSYLNDKEFRQLKTLFSDRPITSISDATTTLRMPLDRTQWSLDSLKKKTDSLYSEMEALYGGDIAAMENSQAVKRLLESEQVIKAQITGIQ